MLNDEELEYVLGSVAMRHYRSSSQNNQAKIRTWAATLSGMTDEKFLTECALHIHESALTMRFSRMNFSDVHCRADACAEESDRRHRVAGHTEECRSLSLYQRAYNKVARDQGHGHLVKWDVPGTCGAGDHVCGEES